MAEIKKTELNYKSLLVGLDVGSTTVKAVVIDPLTDEILWKGYVRHETRQAETLLRFLEYIEEKFPITPGKSRVFITGSGGGTIAPFIGARFVQEVNAISLAVERFYPDTGSVIEIGGQDSKIIIWVKDEESGKKFKFPTMNDKCAGGTGAVIDKIGAKLGLSQENIQNLRTESSRLHPVAGRCGVFAETDINSLQKQGIAAEELMNSLFEAIVQQNLSVLTRGNVLLPDVLLLGGPHTFIPALADAWRRNIPKVWKERNVPIPDNTDPAELIKVPGDSQYFAAIGAITFGMGEAGDVGIYRGHDHLREHIDGTRKDSVACGNDGFFGSEIERNEFIERYRVPEFEIMKSAERRRVRGYLGIDGGSTSTKGVIIDESGEILAKAYGLSAGNPLEDTKSLARELKGYLESMGIDLNICGVGTTGYAKDMLKEALQADVAIVETVAHTKSALKYFNNVDVICDVGGQDIKVILINNGRVKDFRLNTQCSAGNGYFLQSTARKFGYGVDEYADAAFSAGKIPSFSYGCAVFLESDIVNFQQLGWRREEILAGLANVLPRNIWLYVVQEPNLKKLGKTFVLQGGTQKNLAAVKAQYDYIRSKVHDAELHVHPHTGESGAIGAALEAISITKGKASSFIGFEALEGLTFSSLRDESTRCHFCKNKCMRTFIDIGSSCLDPRRYIIAPCEKGMVKHKEEMLSVRRRLEEVMADNPDLSRDAVLSVFQKADTNKQEKAKTGWFFQTNNKKQIKIGIPRALNLWSVAPFFIAYLESVGVEPKNIIFSDLTDEEMFREGSRRGSIDQCFPSKATLAHIHNLIYKKEVDVILFPIIVDLPSLLDNTLNSLTCPTVQASPEVCKAAFAREKDVFAERRISYIEPVLNMGEPDLLEKQMYECFKPLLGVGRHENRNGVAKGFTALESLAVNQRRLGGKVLEMLEEEKRVGLVLLGRPYHNDPGLNHQILEEIRKKGYPILTIDSLPVDSDILDSLFGQEVKTGAITSPLDISDVWKNSYSENSNRKIWGAKYVARHPNLAALDLSNFKCGHDSPIYSVVEDILQKSGTPYFTFHDIDENKPSGSIKIRVETIDYFLKQYERDLKAGVELELEFENRVRAYEEELMSSCA